MARKKQFKLNKESEHDLEIIKYFEPYFDLSLHLYRKDAQRVTATQRSSGNTDNGFI